MTDPEQLWNQSRAVEFFSRHRNKPEDLYQSELRLLPELLAQGLRVLDVGCAAGGLLAVLREYEPELDYIGVDCSTLMVAEARRRFPGFRFEVGDARALPFTNESFDLVICTGGTLVTNLMWRQVLRECWRVTCDTFLFDLRVVADGENLEDVTRSSVRLAFDGEWNAAPLAPYVIVNAQTAHEAVSALRPAPTHVRGIGYHHAVSEMARTPHQEVCMVQLCLAKRRHVDQPDLRWEVPFHWPGHHPEAHRS
jgi:SAM-dependent methyltransferase